MTTRNLKEVVITNRDSCKTYVLKRLGIEYLMDLTIKEIYESDKFEKLVIPEFGSLLIWATKPGDEQYLIAHKINEYGQVIEIKRFQYGHCAVFEANDLVSDCYIDKIGNGVTAQLRIREYNSLRKPDYILKLK